MRKFILILCTVLLLAACNEIQKPKFIKIENVEVVDTNLSLVTLKADALFENPNGVGGKIATDSVRVFVNNIDMAVLSSEEFSVPKKAEFSVPIEVKIPLSKLLNNEGGNLFEQVISVIDKKKFTVQFKGVIDYKIAGIKIPYALDESTEVEL